MNGTATVTKIVADTVFRVRLIGWRCIFRRTVHIQITILTIHQVQAVNRIYPASFSSLYNVDNKISPLDYQNGVEKAPHPHCFNCPHGSYAVC